MDFLNRVKHFDKDNISEKILTRVRKLVNDRKNFKVEDIMKSSKAAGGLAKWCRAMFVYAETLKIVKPKQEISRCCAQRAHEYR